MTDKRFIVVYDDIIDLGSIYDSETERFISVGLLTRTELICNLLNELNNENYMLKKSNKYLQEYNNKLLRKPLLTDVLPNAIEIMNINRELEKENDKLKEVLGNILLEVKRDITNTTCTGEIKVFINPNSYDLISDVLRKYGGLKGWYE